MTRLVHNGLAASKAFGERRTCFGYRRRLVWHPRDTLLWDTSDPATGVRSPKDVQFQSRFPEENKFRVSAEQQLAVQESN